MNIINSSVHMKSEPSENSPLETECLFGETIEVFDDYLDWIYCKLNTDNYCGWIKKKALGKLEKSTHRVLVKRSFIYADKNPKSHCLFYLPMGAKLVINNIQSGWAEMSLFNNKIKIGYIPSMHLARLDHKVNDWVATAQLLNGTPYKWGGRNTIGIDCSALLQLSYQTYGEDIPRNTSQQVKLEKKQVQNINDLNRGCVIFWEGHVGIMVDKINCIHANSYQMKTTTEPLTNIIDRMGSNFKMLKMMDFN